MIIGASAGGVVAVRRILSKMPESIDFPMLIVLHRMKNVDSRLDSILQTNTSIPVCEVEDKQRIEPNRIYVAPPNYHVHFEENETFSLSSDELVNFSRPSIDVSMQSAAIPFGKNSLAIILTGANEDGARGLKSIAEAGGIIIIQDPADAEISRMPEAACLHNPTAAVLPLSLITEFILEYHENNIPQLD